MTGFRVPLHRNTHRGHSGLDLGEAHHRPTPVGRPLALARYREAGPAKPPELRIVRPGNALSVHNSFCFNDFCDPSQLPSHVRYARCGSLWLYAVRTHSLFSD